MPNSNLSNKRKKVPPNHELLKPIEQQGWWRDQPGSKIKVDFKLKHHFCWCSKCKLDPLWLPKEKIKVEFKLKQ